MTTELVSAASGDSRADARLWRAVYEELRDIAHRELGRERPGHTLSTTALVNEAYLKLVDRTAVARRDRAHFFALSCRAMRQVLVDYARQRNAEKREAAKRAVPLDEATALAATGPRDLLALDQALTRIAQFNERLGQVIELRFFGGLTVEETAKVLDVTPRTVERDWSRARAYLQRMLSDQDD
jgi:RNA polymerase sigma factor (TIGR02999 family)